MFIEFSQKEFESFLSNSKLDWQPYQYDYANSLKAGELAYAIYVNMFTSIVLYSTIEPNSRKNQELGKSGSRPKGTDAIRFVVLYRNNNGEKKAVGGYPRLYRSRNSKEELFNDIITIIEKISSLVKEGMINRCGCGKARPPRFKALGTNKSPKAENNWFLGGCLDYYRCSRRRSKN